jgi:hypothetical protein
MLNCTRAMGNFFKRWRWIGLGLALVTSAALVCAFTIFSSAAPYDFLRPYEQFQVGSALTSPDGYRVSYTFEGDAHKVYALAEQEVRFKGGTCSMGRMWPRSERPGSSASYGGVTTEWVHIVQDARVDYIDDSGYSQSYAPGWVAVYVTKNSTNDSPWMRFKRMLGFG